MRGLGPFSRFRTPSSSLRQVRPDVPSMPALRPPEVRRRTHGRVLVPDVRAPHAPRLGASIVRRLRSRSSPDDACARTPIRASQPCGSRFANKRPQPNASPESARRPGDSARKRPFLRGRRTAGALPAFGPVKKRDEVLTSMNVGVPETPRVWHTRKRPPGADRFSRPPFLPKPTHKTASRSHDRQCR